MAETFYNKLPAVVDPSFSLDVMEPALWEMVSQFYKEVRNPLFHGYQLADVNTAGTLEALQMLDKVYDWMDGWWDSFKVA